MKAQNIVAISAGFPTIEKLPAPQMNYKSLLQIPDLPCHFGSMPTPNNFQGLPDVLPFELAVDLDIGILRHIPVAGLSDVMAKAYQEGNMLGTPLAGDDLGKAYVDDFLDFLNSAAIKGRRGLRILEIGAGSGYLSLMLQKAGHRVTAIEPGKAYKSHWDQYGVDVLNTFFPTPEAPGPFDIIVSTTVLEHIEDTVSFLATMRDHLGPDGLIVSALPNDYEEIAAGDPGMLIHEHYLYFTPGAVRRLLEAADLAVHHVAEAGYSRVLYSVAGRGGTASTPITSEEMALYENYAPKLHRFKEAVAKALEDNRRAGRSLGIYCPSRSLAVLPLDIDARFFDDAPYYHGQFFPPFTIAIENRQDFFDNPVEELWIMSRSFSGAIRRNLEPAISGTFVRTIEEFN